MRRANTGYQYPNGSSYGNGQVQGDSMIEAENDLQTDHLKGKISALKSLTIDIGNEVRDQNKLLADMDDEFDSAGGFLGKAMGRVKKLAKGSQNYIAMYLIIFSLIVFFFIWILTKFRS